MSWLEFLDWKDIEEFRREDFYLAQIAAEVRRSRVKRPKAVRVEQMLLKFKSNQEKRKRDARGRFSSKSFWLNSLGVPVRKD